MELVPITKIRMLKPEEAARRARENVEKFKREQERKAAEARRKPAEPAQNSKITVPPQKKPEAQSPFDRPTVNPISPFAKQAPLVEEISRAEAPRSKEELNRELIQGGGIWRKGDVEALLKEGAEINAKNSDGWTALMKAAANKDEEKCRILVDAGADVNASDPNGYTALMGAASIGNTAIVLMLIEAKADVNAKDKSHGRSALDFAKTWGRTDAAGILENHGAKLGSELP